MSKRLLILSAFLLVSSLAASASDASFVQQGSKLVGTGAVGGAQQGISISVSGDGNTAIVGGFMDDSGTGAAWVFTRSGEAWIQQGSKLVGTGAVGAAVQGRSVSLSGDGNTAIVGGYLDDSGTGAAWVFTRSGGVWSQEGSKLVGTGAVGAAIQGFSVSVSGDGNTAIVGGYNDDSGVGAAWVFTRTGGVWSQQGPKLVGTGAVGGAYQGRSVALSADGNTAIVGGYQDDSNTGAAWVFTRSGGVWSQQGSKLVGTGAVGQALQGQSVSLSSDGNTAIVGGMGDNSDAGAAWVFTRSGGVWSQQGLKLVGTGATGTLVNQGYSVSISGDGNTAIVGGFYDNSTAGAAWAFTRTSGAWSQLGSKLVGTGAVGAAGQGWSVSVSGDGNTAIVGGYFDDFGTGAAWVFADYAPKFAMIGDVPNDEGGKVTLRWTASPLDVVPANPINEYWIWRQVPARLAARALTKGATLLSDRSSASAPVSGRTFRATESASAIYYWEYVGSQVAHGYPGYSYTAPTLSDSVPGSNPYTVFMVEAEKLSTGEYWSSAPGSGYSVDNLPPGPPAPLAAAYFGGATHFHWAANTEGDLASYRLYRGGSEDFVPSPGNLVATAYDTTCVDAGPAGGYYKMSAVDIHANESGFTLVTPSMTTGLGDSGGVIAFALGAVAPNPLSGGGTFHYSLPGGRGTVLLSIFDVSGRLVRVLAREQGGVGEHTVRWDGRDASGRQVGSGIYFARLEYGDQVRVGKVVVAR